nr:efflux RND transporter periplasmic adaptor subunit [Paracoccus sp. PAMC 22219]
MRCCRAGSARGRRPIRRNRRCPRRKARWNAPRPRSSRPAAPWTTPCCAPPEQAVVTAKSVAPGQVVAAAQPVLTLAALSGLEAVFHAPDDPLLRDILGRDVRMETLDVDRPDMVGTVTEIAPLVDPQTGTVTVRARLLTPNAGTVLLGASVRGHLSMAMEQGVVVPWTALMRSGDDPAVWVVDDEGRVALTKVVINHFADGTIFVSDGLSDGQRVVGDGAQLLYPGRRVQPVEGDAP